MTKGRIALEIIAGFIAGSCIGLIAAELLSIFSGISTAIILLALGYTGVEIQMIIMPSVFDFFKAGFVIGGILGVLASINDIIRKGK